MKRFAELYEEIDATTSTTGKVDALARYFSETPAEDAAWALFFLTGRRFLRLPVRALAGWALEITGIPGWLFEECYSAVGDLAESIALILDGQSYEPPVEPPIGSRDPRVARDLFAPTQAAPPVDPSSLSELAQAVAALRDLPEEAQRARVLRWWRGRSRTEVMLLTKMMTGELRVGVSALLVMRGLSKHSGVPAAVLAHRMMGTWEPSAESFGSLIAPAGTDEDPSRPYPFALATQLDDPIATLGDRTDWLVEWKWDGIRCQLVRRAGGSWLWSRGEELMNRRFPEIDEAARALPDGVVLDGEAIAWRGESPLPFAVMQRRIGRKVLSAKVLSEAPVLFVACDLIEEGGDDLRERAQRERRARLEAVIARAGEPRLRLSPLIDAPTWEALAELRGRSRERGVEGLMLKHVEARYRAGRHRGELWKWKIEPHSVDMVLIYAQPGSGRRSNLFTDYTFGVWDGGELVPVAKAYSGLDDDEILELDRWIRHHTLDRPGPLRVVEPTHVFELVFEGIAVSKRHRSGIAVRFPRIARWRRDKPAAEADSLETLRGMISVAGSTRA